MMKLNTLPVLAVLAPLGLATISATDVVNRNYAFPA